MRKARPQQNYIVNTLENTISITFDNKRYGMITFLLDNNKFNIDFLEGRPHLLLQAVKAKTGRTFFYITYKPDSKVNKYKYLHRLIAQETIIDPTFNTTRVKFIDDNSRNMTLYNMKITEIHQHIRKKPVHTDKKQNTKKKQEVVYTKAVVESIIRENKQLKQQLKEIKNG